MFIVSYKNEIKITTLLIHLFFAFIDYFLEIFCFCFSWWPGFNFYCFHLAIVTVYEFVLYLQRKNLIYFIQCPGTAVHCIAMHYISSLHTAQCALHSILSDAGQFTNKPVQREQKRQNKVICQFTVLHTVLQLKSCDPQRSKNPIAVLLQFFNAVVHTWWLSPPYVTFF